MTQSEFKEKYVKERIPNEYAFLCDELTECDTHLRDNLDKLNKNIASFNEAIETLKENFHKENDDLVIETNALLADINALTKDFNDAVQLEKEHSDLIYILVRYYIINDNIYTTPISLSKLNKVLNANYSRQDIIDIISTPFANSYTKMLLTEKELGIPSERSFGRFWYWLSKGKQSFME